MDFPKRNEIKVGTVAFQTTDGTDAVVTRVFADDVGCVWSFRVRVLAPKARKLSPTMQKALDTAKTANPAQADDRCVFGRVDTLGALFGAGAVDISFAYDTRACAQPRRNSATHRLPIEAAKAA